jgi:hypothetical protein
MADMAARDTIDRLLRSQDRLRESADRTSVSFYRLEQYARRAALALARVGGGGKSNKTRNETYVISNITNITNATNIIDDSLSITTNITNQKSEEAPWEKILDIGSKIIGALAIVSVINDGIELKKKHEERKAKSQAPQKTTQAAKQMVSACQCCSGGKQSASPSNGGKKTNSETGSNSRKQSGNVRAEGVSSKNSLDERTKPKTPNNRERVVSKRNKKKATEKKGPYKNKEAANKADTTKPPATPEEKLGDKTKPVTPTSTKKKDTKEKQPTNLDDKTRPSNPPDSKKPPGPGPGPNNFMSGSGGFKAFEGLSKLGKSAMKYLGGSNPLGRTALGMMSIAAAEDKTAAIVDTLASAGGATVGSIVGSAILPGVGTVVGGMVGGWLGEKAGRFLNNTGWFGKKTNEEEGSPPVNSSVLSSSAANLNLYPASAPLPLPGPNSLAAPNPADLPAPTYNISVEGVQLNMPKEEIDEESLARKIGWEIVSKMKLAMDNRVAT